MGAHYLDGLVGVGLDSDEKDNPPAKFAEVFARARELGLKLTMHCDVNQKDIVPHMWECLDLISVDRIDHGINALDDEALVDAIQARDLGLTICPISNRFVVQDLTGTQIRQFLERGIKATVNSDDPGYFRGYMNENLLALAHEAAFTREEIAQLTRNAFSIAWLSDGDKAQYLADLDAYLTRAT